MKYLYVLIRIPKSGSQTLRELVKRSFPESRYFRLPALDIEPPRNPTLLEMLRKKRSMLKGTLQYGAFSEKGMWEKIAGTARPGDILSGHLAYGRADLLGWELRHITLLRNPIERMISEYYYTRESFLDRSRFRRAYLKGKPAVAAKGNLTDYLRYLADHKERYANPATAYITGDRAHHNPLEFLQHHYFHFGVLEHLNEFAVQLAEKTGTEPQSNIWVNKTRTKKRYSPTEEDNELLNVLLDTDIPLYQAVKDICQAPCP